MPKSLSLFLKHGGGYVNYLRGLGGVERCRNYSGLTT